MLMTEILGEMTLVEGRGGGDSSLHCPSPPPPILSTPHRQAATLDLKSKEEKDAELDKKIEALRRKNEALIRRYQEIEEDRKKAELEGVAVTAPRKGRLLEKENVAVELVSC